MTKEMPEERSNSYPKKIFCDDVSWTDCDAGNVSIDEEQSGGCYYIRADRCDMVWKVNNISGDELVTKEEAREILGENDKGWVFHPNERVNNIIIKLLEQAAGE